MNNLKRVAVFLAIVATLVIVGISYKGNDILQRAIVLGVGVDTDGDELSVTVEIVSPGNGGEQVGMFSKIVNAKGKTVAEALQKISEKSGKETSLGQCVLIVYGEDYFRTDFSSTANYFARSDSMKENTIVCCCKGKAEDLFNKGDAVTQSVSLAIADKLKGMAKAVAVPSCDLLTFARSQRELYKTGFLNYVTFEMSENTNPQNPDQPQGFFASEKVAVFRENKFVQLLTKQETAGFAILNNAVSGNDFAVEGKDGQLFTLRANSKNVDYEQKDGKIKMSVDIKVKFARTDSFGAGEQFTAKTEAQIPQEMLEQAKKQSEELAMTFLQKQVEYDFDLLDIHDIFRQKYGSTEEVKSLKMKDIPLELTISVSEK